MTNFLGLVCLFPLIFLEPAPILPKPVLVGCSYARRDRVKPFRQRCGSGVVTLTLDRSTQVATGCQTVRGRGALVRDSQVSQRRGSQSNDKRREARIRTVRRRRSGRRRCLFFRAVWRCEVSATNVLARIFRPRLGGLALGRWRRDIN